MRLLDKPYTRTERDNVIRMLEGNINRICVSDDPEEIIRCLGFAINDLSMLAYSRVKELNEQEITNFLEDE